MRRNRSAQRQKIRRDFLRKIGIMETTIMMLEEDLDFIRDLAKQRIEAKMGKRAYFVRPKRKLYPGERRRVIRRR